MKQQLSAIEIIDETVQYYSEDPKRRAQSVKDIWKEGDPIGSKYMYQYITIDGRMCAVGRCMIAPQIEWEGYANYIESSNDIEGYNGELDNLLKEKYKGHPEEMWAAIQSLHDTDEYWNKNGITAEGKKYVKKLKEQWG